MHQTILLMLAVSLPYPVAIQSKPNPRLRVKAVERSPMWGKNPYIIAKFHTLPHMSRESQLGALEHGRKVAADYDSNRLKLRMPIVGQVQQSTSFSYGVTRSFSTAIPYLGSPDAPIPITPQNIGSHR